MFKGQYLSFILFLLLFWVNLASQNLVRYGISDGLAHKHVRHFYQDSKGFLWIGTWNGISRFDGHHFTSFQHDSGDSTSILNEEVTWITEDSLGNIWSFTRNGIMKYSGGDNFTRVFLDETHKKDFKPLGSQTLVFDYSGTGWFLEEQGLFSFSSDLKKIRRLGIPNITFKESNAILADKSGLWITTINGICFFKYETLNQNNFITEEAADIFILNRNWSQDFPGGFLRSINDRLLVHYTNKGIYELDVDDGELKQLIGKHTAGVGNITEFRRFYEISPGIIAFGKGQNGMLMFDLNSNTFIDEHPLLNYTSGLDIHAILMDKQHNIWVGSLNGVLKYSCPQLTFKSWLYDPEDTNSLSGENLTHVFKDAYRHLWVSSTSGGIERIDPESGLVTKIRLPDKYHIYTNPNRGNYIYQLDSNMFLLAYDSAVFKYNLKQNSFDFVMKVDRHVRQVAKDDDGKLYMVASNGRYILNYKNEKLTLDSEFNIGHEKAQYQSNWDIEILDDRIILGQRKGLTIIDKNNFSNVACFVPDGAKDIPYVLCVYPASSGLVWIGTMRDGIYAFDMTIKEFVSHFDMNDGLIDNSVNAIFEDNNGYLWASTWKGIAKVIPETGEIYNYSTVNGLPFPEFNTEVYCRDDDGNIYFGGLGGVIEMHPRTFVNFETPNDLKIIEVHAWNKLLPLTYPLGNDEQVKLEFEQNDFSVFFSSFDFRHAHERRYRYKLNGYDSKWRQLTNNDFAARYANVPSGSYTLTIGSTYQNWPWVGKQTNLKISIKPPPVYKRQSFLVAILIILGLSLTTIIILRLRNKNMQKEVMITRLEKESNLAKLNFLKSQMNPHFYFNTLNAINSFVLKHEIREANIYLTKFAKLMREVLDNSQKEFVKIADEKAVLEKYLALQQLRFQNLFDYEINVDQEVEDKEIPPMFLQPFIENSVEYAFVDMQVKGWLTISFNLDGEQIICSVIDNGIGIDRSQQIKRRSKRSSTAIKNIFKRIYMLNSIYETSINIEIAKLHPDNVDFPGTRIVLKMPDFGKLVKSGQKN